MTALVVDKRMAYFLRVVTSIKINSVMNTLRKNKEIFNNTVNHRHIAAGRSHEEVTAYYSMMLLKKVVLIPPEKPPVEKSAKKRKIFHRQRQRQRKKNTKGLKCNWCEETHTGVWRKGPDGKYLCNACGLQYSRGYTEEQTRNRIKKSRGKWKKVFPLQ